MVELTASQYRHSQRDYSKLQKTQGWLKDNWQTVLSEMKLRLPAGFNLVARMISVSFATGEASVIETKVIKLYLGASVFGALFLAPDASAASLNACYRSCRRVDKDFQIFNIELVNYHSKVEFANSKNKVMKIRTYLASAR